MSKAIIKIHDTETNEIIEREMTEQEIAELNPIGIIDETSPK